ncbi:hypothetical protein CAAN1_06S04588 [[Candida] anglica]|uniref:SAC3/GANP/THP3 conserved domain-containing protein n=1 Tax=[Candida] anglica TaxID=148631 RepID=A0ABP0EL64_9ASCO
MAGLYNEVQPALTKNKKKKQNVISDEGGSGVNIEGRGGVGVGGGADTNNNSTNKNNSSNNTPKDNSSSTDWPESLELFVQNSFSEAMKLSTEQQTIFHEQLGSIVTMAKSQNLLWENDWSRQTLPIIQGSNEQIKLVGPPNRGKRGRDDKVPISIPPSLPTSLPRIPKATGLETPPPHIARVSTPVERVSSPIGSGVSPGGADYDSRERKRQRMERFGTESPKPKYGYQPPRSNNGPSGVVGTCLDLEKHYLRLTSEPDPSRVRPLEILKASLIHILEKHEFSPEQYSYKSYLNNQFKSIRQDLTVQHIKNDFTIEVYEVHARVAIENNDLGEFNQCQSQLKYLYRLKRDMGGLVDDKFMNSELEFLSYRILYMLMTGNHSEIYKMKLELYSDTTELPKRQRVRLFKCVEALFDLQGYLIQGNYYHFFRIYRFLQSKSYMRLACHLMEHFLVEKQRLKSLAIISRSYRKIGLLYLTEILNFSTDANGPDNILGFLEKHKLTVYVQGNELDCVQSRGSLQNMVVQQGFKKIDIKGQI